jgi:hypothetical protein
LVQYLWQDRSYPRFRKLLTISTPLALLLGNPYGIYLRAIIYLLCIQPGSQSFHISGSTWQFNLRRKFYLLWVASSFLFLLLWLLSYLPVLRRWSQTRISCLFATTVCWVSRGSAVQDRVWDHGHAILTGYWVFRRIVSGQWCDRGYIQTGREVFGSLSSNCHTLNRCLDIQGELPWVSSSVFVRPVFAMPSQL